MQQRQKAQDEAESEDDAIEDRFTMVGGAGMPGRHPLLGGGGSSDSEMASSSSSGDSFSEEEDEGEQKLRGTVSFFLFLLYQWLRLWRARFWGWL